MARFKTSGNWHLQNYKNAFDMIGNEVDETDKMGTLVASVHHEPLHVRTQEVPLLRP